MNDNFKTKIEVLKQIYAAINQNRVSDTLQFFDPDIVRVEPEGFPSSGTYRGHSEILKHFVESRGTWAEGSCEIEGFIPAGDKVVVLVHVRVRLKDRTDWVEGRISDVFTFRGEKVIEFRTIADTHKALIWAGVAVP